MKDIKKCSISGIAFTLTVDAYNVLNSYLESLQETYRDPAEGSEIIADIEARIAELILSHQDNTQVVETDLMEQITAQMGSATDISETSDENTKESLRDRIPRRLYRDMQQAKLGGVCAGLAKYFDIDLAWVRLLFFTPLLGMMLGWIPFMVWLVPLMGRLAGIFIIGYFVMWFVVPAAKTARQKLEMQGERISVRSIHDQTVQSPNIQSEAQSLLARIFVLFGQIVLILLKIFAGIIIFGLVLGICGLIVGLFVIGFNCPFLPGDFHSPTITWLSIMGCLVLLIPALLLLYTLLCLIASRKPNSKALFAGFLFWLATLTVTGILGVRFTRNEDASTVIEKYIGNIREETAEPVQHPDPELQWEAADTTAVTEGKGPESLRQIQTVPSDRKIKIQVDGHTIDIDYDDSNYK